MFDHGIDRFTNPLKSVFTRALMLARATHAPLITPEHLLYALATQKASLGSVILERARIACDELCKERFKKTKEHKNDIPPDLAPATQRILEKALLVANLHDHPFVGTEHLLFGFLQANLPELNTLLFQKARIQKDILEKGLIAILKEGRTRGIDEQKINEEKNKKEACDHCGEVHEENDEDALAYFGKELTKKENLINTLPLIGRTQEIDRLITILTRKIKHNPLLVGEPGVGKTAIVEGLAKRIRENKVPPALKNTKIIALDVANILAGAMYRGDFEARILDILDEAKEQKNVILFIDEFHTLVHGGGGIDAANIIKPALGRGDVRIIGATTIDEYKKHLESEAALARRMECIAVHEPTKEETEKILSGVAKTLAKHHKTTFSEARIKEIVNLTDRFLPNKRFPDKAIDVLDETGARAQGRTATTQDILLTIAAQSNTSLALISTHETETLKRLKTIVHKNIIGQTDVKNAVLKSITRAKLGIADTRRPLASFVFAGPSGVGKTELAKSIAEGLSEKKDCFLRLDMSEYSEPYSVSKLIGAPAGYVGYKERAHLTDTVKNQPNCVIVFDECEKAHKNIHHLLLQILEEGELRDASGTLVNFRNTIIILTTNAGREIFEKTPMGFTQSGTNTSALRDALEEHFSGELLNRCDALCLFHPLSEEDLEGIFEKELEALTRRLAKQNISMYIEKNITKILAKNIPRKKGAREIRSLMRTHIEEPLGEKILAAGKKKKRFTLKKTAQGTIEIS